MKCRRCKTETVNKKHLFYRWNSPEPDVLFDGPWCDRCKCYTIISYDESLTIEKELHEERK